MIQLSRGCHNHDRAIKRLFAWVMLLSGMLYLSNAMAFDIQVQATGGGAIPAWTYLINEDNSGDPWDANASNHPSQHQMASHSPIVAAGNQTNASGISLPAGRYLVSVRAPGHKLWGKHVRLDGAGNVIEVAPFTRAVTTLPSTVTIELIPDPHPLAKVLVQVFEDNHPTNSAPDPLEQRLEGFQVSIHDTVGDVTVDWYLNPLCTEYQRNPDGSFVLDPDGAPIPIPGTGGICLTDANGEVVIENIPYGRYEIEVIPPPGSDWVGTTTLEGTRFLDAWLEEGSDGTRFGRQTGLDFLGPEVYWYGFIRPTTISGGSATITGRVVNLLGFPPTQQFFLDTNEPMPYPWVGVNNIGGNDELVHAARGNVNGAFTITNVPAGVYQLAIWDEPREWIIGYYTVQVADGQTVDLGDIGMRRWFGWVSGHVFLEPSATANALFDSGDTPLPNIDLLIRFRDGSINQSTFTDTSGFYEFPQARSPLGKFQVAEVGFGRFGVTGHSKRDPYDPGAVPEVFAGGVGGELLANQLTWESRRSIIDWGKRVYTGSENGGVSGAIIYATTRNEFDARLAAAEDYEPGIPNVTVKLWQAVPAPGFSVCDPTNPASCTRGAQVNEIQSDGWSHPTAADDPSRGCDVLDVNGDPVTGTTPDMVADNCIEVPMVGNETQDGAWDGGWAIDAMCPVGTFPCDEAAQVPMPPGDYIVEVVTPPFHQILKEEDQNTDEGSELVPLVPPAPCVGPSHLVTDPRNPYNGQMKPLCNMRLVTVQAGQNTAADFYFFTDSDNDGNAATRNWVTTDAVPIPGRLFGVVENDLFVDTDPNSLTFAEPRPVAHVPVGIRDYTGRLLTVVYTDEYGRWEAMVPSSFQANCPIPGGVCPGMYIVNPNDPGDANNPFPGFDATYKLTTTTFEVFPGKMRHADTPIDPLQGADAGAGACDAFPGDDPFSGGPLAMDPERFPPQIYLVSSPIGVVGDQITITGPRFRQPGTTGDQGNGTVTLDGVNQTVVSWSNEDITFTVGGVAPGRHQLIVTTDDGQSTVPGLTFHVIGTGYNPLMTHVFPPANVNTPVIQNAINAAGTNGRLIVIHPGHYRENVIVSKGVRLQGYGQGGYRGIEAPPTGGGRVFVQGSVIDGRWIFTDPARQAAWDATLAGASFDDNGQTVPKGASITVVANPPNVPTRIDGLRIAFGAGEGGGGIHVHAFCDGCEFSNNLLEENQGTLVGGISLGQPSRSLPPDVVDAQNDNIRIHHNRLVGNGATLYGGGVGIFGGADNYLIDFNRICGNFSAQYGGGIAHWGRSTGGRIQDNDFYFNDAFDEGGAILIGGESQLVPPGTTGSGAVDITHNIIQANFSNDDGGGVRLLRPGQDLIRIVNNIFNNNVAADMGGAISLDDASNVRIVNNSIAGNHTTATAEDRDLSCFTDGIPPYPGAGCPHGAGLVSEGNSTLFQASLPAGAPTFSNPVLFNNIFWDNDAQTFDPVNGLVTQAIIDLEVFGTATPQFFSPTFSVLTVAYNPAGDHPSNIVASPDPVLEPAEEIPLFVSTEVGEFLGYDIRAVASLIDGAVTVVQERPPSRPGDFHLLPGSPAVNAGTPSSAAVTAPSDDFEHDARPQGAGFDMGADEVIPGEDNVGPVFEPGGAAPLATPNPTAGAASVVLTATATDVNNGNSNIVRVEWWEGTVDPGLGNGNAMTAVDGNFNSPTEAVTATINVSGWTLGVHVINARALDSAGNWGPVDNIELTVSLPPVTLYFSTATNSTIPGVAAPYDNADIYVWNGTSFSRLFDATANGLGGGANIDALKVIDGDTFYVSFSGATTSVPGIGTVMDEDIVLYNAGTWSMQFDGSDVGLAATSEDVDAFDILPDGRLLISTEGGATVPLGGVPGVGPFLTVQDEDLMVFTPTTLGATTSGTFAMYFDGSDVGLSSSASEDVDGVTASGADIYLSTRGAYTVGGSFTGGGDDIFACQSATTGPSSACASFQLLFDGSANGIVDNLDAFSF